MKISNELAQKLFDLDRKEMANFIALFSSLNIDDEYASNFGKIKKVSDDTFKVIVNDKNYENILEELLGHDDTINDIFKSK